MFDKLKKPVKRQNTRKSTVELVRTKAFLQCLVGENLRLSYAALADAAAELGEHTPTGLSAGQRGSRLVKSLPLELQPHICRGNGSYQKGTEWPNVEVPSDLRDRPHIRPEAVKDYVQAFVEATDEDLNEIEATDEDLNEIEQESEATDEDLSEIEQDNN